MVATVAPIDPAQHLGLAMFIAKRFFRRGRCLDDLFSEACVALVRSARSFRPSMGCKFSSYACRAIQRHLRRVFIDTPLTLKRDGRAVQIVEGYDLIDPNHEDHPCRRALDAELLVIDLLAVLSSREREVISKHYGLDGRRRMTLEEIGAEMGVSRQWVQQIEATALERMRVMGQGRNLAFAT